MSCTTTSECTGGQVCAGGKCDAAVLLLAGSATSLLTGSFQASTGWSTGTISTDATSFGPALTIDSTGRGVGVYASATGKVVSAVTWADGAWGTPAAINAGATARSRPAIDATGGMVSHVVYQDSAYAYWYLGFSGTWGAPQQVGTASNQFYGPVSAAIAARGADATAAFIDGQSPSVNYAAQSDLGGGTWQARADLAGPESFTVPPAIIPLSAGPELMMVVVDQNTKIYSLTRTSGTWSAPAYIDNCLTGDPMALAPLPNGGAILAFRGTDGYLYWTVYSGGAWSTVAPLSSPNATLTGAPAVTHGIGGHVAEIAFVGSGGNAYHASLTGSTWSAPAMVGGGSLTGVAIAAVP